MKLFHITEGPSTLSYLSIHLMYNKAAKIIQIRRLYKDEESLSLAPNANRVVKVLTDGSIRYIIEPDVVIEINQDLITELAPDYDYQHWVVTWNPRTFSLSIPTEFFRVNAASKFPTPALVYGEHYPVFTLSRPLKTTSFDACICVCQTANIFIEGDLFDYEAMSIMETGGVVELRKSFFPVVSLTSSGNLTPTNFVSMTSEVDVLEGEELELYYESINGQLSHNRKLTNNGIATIRVSAPNMDIGDYVRVKVGSKYYKGINEITIPVTSGENNNA